ncbi:hypothetical protein QQY66_44410 [Streptomyces sp. DG2A-72]|uniref:hypothetical protein n=1 Tax=Streptomyces sp. DG2A-72 TaxID=3051386 RepID=UPI00265BD42A|nr:hypothetical protein [Streptomyces sp. DG2A-72]MDO0938430.1 hypothetical protein [Streptomyces sp. DG2A-72]
MDLVERLVAEGRVCFTDLHDDEVAELRRAVDFAKRHSLEPQGKRIEKARIGARGLEMFLAEGPHPNVRSRRPEADASVVPVSTRQSSLHPAGAALKDDDGQLSVPAVLRRRSLLLQALAAEAVRRGYEVRQSRSAYSLCEGGVDVVVGGFACAVGVRQEFPRRTQSAPRVLSSRLAMAGPVGQGVGETGRTGRSRTP